jgi:hypothetical protein
MPIDEKRWGVEHSRALTLIAVNDGRMQGGCPVSAWALWLCTVVALEANNCELECVRPPWSRMVIWC